MRRRKLRVALVTVSVVLAVQALAAIPVAQADTCTITVKLITGQVLTFPGVPAGTPISSLSIPVPVASTSESCAPRRRRPPPAAAPRLAPPLHLRPPHPQPRLQPRRARPRRRRRAATRRRPRIRPAVPTSRTRARTRAAARPRASRTRVARATPGRSRPARARAAQDRVEEVEQDHGQGRVGVEPDVLVRAPRRRPDRRPELLHRQLPDSAVPAPDLPGSRHPVRRAVAGARGHQRDRDRLRPQPVGLERRRGRLDAVPALDVEDMGPGRKRRRRRRSVQPGRRDLRRRPIPPRGRRLQEHLSGDLRLQPRLLVRPVGAPAREADRRHAGPADRRAVRSRRGSLPGRCPGQVPGQLGHDARQEAREVRERGDPDRI